MPRIRASIAILASLSAFAACAPCEGDRIAREFAGPGAIDCGHVALAESSESADRCAVAAMRAERGFIVSQDLEGIDSAVSEYFVRESASGAMHRIVVDDGGARLGVRIVEQSCVGPMIVTRDGSEQVTCTPSGPMRPLCSR